MTEEMKKIAKETNAALATLNRTPPDMQLFFMYRSTGIMWDGIQGGFALRDKICLHPDEAVAVIAGGYKADGGEWSNLLISTIAQTTAHEMGTEYNSI